MTVFDQSNITIDASSWFTINQSAITAFPKWEMLGSTQSVSFRVIMSLSEFSQQSFTLKIIKNDENNVCNQQNINFIAGTSVSISFMNIISKDIAKSNLVIRSNQNFFNSFFYYSQYNQTVTIAKTTNSDLGQTSVVLQLTDSDNTEYQTNELNLTVVLNKPPTVVFNPGKYIFYENSLTNVMRFDQSLFIDDDHIKFKINEWIINNNKIVSYSLYNPPVQGFISAINIYFAKDFIGKWTYEITAIDELNQTCTIQIDVFVSPWAQKDWIICNSEYQIDWIRCQNGFELDKTTGTWYFESYSNPFKTSSHLFIKLYVVFIIALSIIAIMLRAPKEIWQLVVSVNQVLLLGCLFNNSHSNDMLDFISILQLTKLDLKFLDQIFYSRSFVNSLFCIDQFVGMNQFDLDSGSTFANFCNLFYIFIAFLLIILLKKFIEIWRIRINIKLWKLWIDSVLILVSFISIIKAWLLFLLLNWFSEIFIQINTKFNQNALISYAISDGIIVIYFLIIIFAYKFKSLWSIFSDESIVSHERLYQAKLLLIGLWFASKKLMEFLKVYYII